MIKIFTIISIMCITLIGCKSNTNKQNEGYFFENDKLLAKDSLENYLVITSPKYNFGIISQKEYPSLDLYFNIENRGISPLVIQKVDVSCGCLSVDYPKEPIFPQKKIRLQVHIKTMKQLGTFNKAIFIRSNAKNDPELIRITGQIIQ